MKVTHRYNSAIGSSIGIETIRIDSNLFRRYTIKERHSHRRQSYFFLNVYVFAILYWQRLIRSGSYNEST